MTARKHGLYTSNAIIRCVGQPSGQRSTPSPTTITPPTSPLHPSTRCAPIHSTLSQSRATMMRRGGLTLGGMSNVGREEELVRIKLYKYSHAPQGPLKWKRERKTTFSLPLGREERRRPRPPRTNRRSAKADSSARDVNAVSEEVPEEAEETCSSRQSRIKMKCNCYMGFYTECAAKERESRHSIISIVHGVVRPSFVIRMLGLAYARAGHSQIPPVSTTPRACPTQQSTNHSYIC
jgi:hypothetical protein